MIPRRKRWWPDESEALPVDVLPCSNGEFVPPTPTARQLAIMRLADRESERLRRLLGLSRRDFVRTAAATAVGFWAIDAVMGGQLGRYADAIGRSMDDACDLEWATAGGLETRNNLAGEFIFDVQSHHVDPDGLWRVRHPVHHAFFTVVWPQARPFAEGNGGELDPIENLSRHHYLKELFLDSATTATVLSCVPMSPDNENPLPFAEAIETADTVQHLAGSTRTVLHAFVMPNRGSFGRQSPDMEPLFLRAELDLMMERARAQPGLLRGWKIYPAWGEVPNASGWYLDSPTGSAFFEQVLAVSAAVPEVPPVVAIHKGFALPGFDQAAATPHDVGPAAAAFPGVRFLIYHSGYDTGDSQAAYPNDPETPPGPDDVNKVDALINSLRRHGLDAPSNGGNSPNVYAELGSVWRATMNDPDQAAHLLGKLLTWVGPKRVIWGTDSLWYGSPQPEIVALRRFTFSEQGKALYDLPYGLDGDVEDPRAPAPTPARTIRNAILGRNAAAAYGVDPDVTHAAISCDAVNALQQDYLEAPGTLRESAPLASNQLVGARTRRELFASLKGKPWAP